MSFTSSKGLVLVEWNDAWSDSEPVTEDGIASSHKPMVVRTLGWVLQHDEVGISLANEFYEGHWRGRTFILGVMIKSVTPYKLTKQRAAKVAKETV
jgi:hypothetical protein